MLFFQTPCLILLIINVALSFGGFRLGEDGSDKMNDHELNDLENSLPNLKTKSENGKLLPKPKRSRRSTGDGTQIPENFCPGCSSSYTPYFSGQCFLCPPGTPGPRGSPGQQGIPGRDGRDGRDAMNERGDVGMMDNPDIRADSAMRSNKSGGAVYVRWGQNECPPQSELIYEGVAGGSYYTHKGSGSNYLCMPEEPIYDLPIAGSSGQSRGYVYGAEYQTSNFANWNHLHDNNVYCAVCWAYDRPSLIMVPARNICPGPEWTKEYSGYLVSEHYNHAGRTEYVCMDRNPEAVPRSSHNADGSLFYSVEGRCGSHGSGLPCGPYVDGYELTCAVCTR
ncbi:Short-chain collagen C4 [Holothuria leucospilota]|uniref:Short-chain collagen C4 n=1 Tax=Holothuria leucospilota TaxID=206669 RepID=A0A9Q1HHY2_HOLLE|nr:Short-chain collagen C4 [Holothuria leucospilota]